VVRKGFFRIFLWGGLFFGRRVYKKTSQKASKICLYTFSLIFTSQEKKFGGGGVVKKGKIPFLDTASVVEGEIQISKSKCFRESLNYPKAVTVKILAKTFSEKKS
jgi:hypothetical protein